MQQKVTHVKNMIIFVDFHHVYKRRWYSTGGSLIYKFF